MKLRERFSRHHEIQTFRHKLERDSFPRLQMSLLVLLTGASGFVASYLLLHAGLAEMWLRYLAAIAVAYLILLFMLWLWLRTRAEDYVDIPDLSGLAPSDSSSGFSGGNGGNFGGGGSTASFDSAGSSFGETGNPGASGTSVGDAIGSVAEAEEFAIPLVLLIIVVAVVFSSAFIIYSAPALFAELLVDGVLSASLYRKLRGLETRHWLETALRRTLWPFILTAVIISASGWGLAHYAPGAHSIAEVIAHAQSETSGRQPLP